MDGIRKRCSKCRDFKLLKYFYKQKSKKSGLASACKECTKVIVTNYYYNNKEKFKVRNKINYDKNTESRLEWYEDYKANNKEKLSERYKRYHYLRKYKISREEIRKIAEFFGMKCGICLSEFRELGKGKPWMTVDHNHETGEIRGIICNRCNVGIGLFLENPIFMRNAALYIESGGNFIQYKENLI